MLDILVQNEQKKVGRSSRHRLELKASELFWARVSLSGTEEVAVKVRNCKADNWVPSTSIDTDSEAG